MSDTPSLASIPGLDTASLSNATIKLHLVYTNPNLPPPPYDQISSPAVHRSSHADDPRRGGARRRSRMSTAAGETQPGESRHTRSIRFPGHESTPASAGSRSIFQHTNDGGPDTTPALIDPEIGSGNACAAYTWSGCASFIRDQATSGLYSLLPINGLSSILPSKDDIAVGAAIAGATFSGAVVLGLATTLANDLADGGDGSKWWRQVSDLRGNVMSGLGLALHNDYESEGVPDGKAEDHMKWW